MTDNDYKNKDKVKRLYSGAQLQGAFILKDIIARSFRNEIIYVSIFR
jgi:hypothetical protein